MLAQHENETDKERQLRDEYEAWIESGVGPSPYQGMIIEDTVFDPELGGFVTILEGGIRHPGVGYPVPREILSENSASADQSSRESDPRPSQLH